MSRGGGGGKPTAGGEYVLQEDGTYEEIAAEAYGISSGQQFAALAGANQQSPATKLKKGQTVIIPGRKTPVKMTGKDSDDLTIIIDGVEIPMICAKIFRAMDTASDGWTGRIAWTPGADARIDKATRPYGYTQASAYIGNELQVNGCLYIVNPKMTIQGITKELHGFSYTADAIDSSVSPPYEFRGCTLQQIANAKGFCPSLGIKAIFQWDPGGAFPIATAHAGESIFQFLVRLAAQRGGLISNTPEGDMLFLQADINQKPVGTIQEGQPFAEGWEATYDGRKRFFAYRCITAGMKGRQSPEATFAALVGSSSKKIGPVTVIEYDTSVPRSRFQTFKADNVTPGNVLDAAKWRRNKQFVDSLTLPFPVASWYAPNGKLWNVNTLVTVISPTLGVAKGFTYLIRSVEFDYSDKRRTALLHLVPPQAFTGMNIEDVWTY